ncbi:broad specificity amino-acid racemase RacX [Phoenix dactylifera]|uniref:Broad specificity amino-acid racemase RacX n=1 Tax=Phoenix dactylifera TaxID=42345 RepID=A0A8B7D2U0_PHODC|nr:broad specificity amino-acid racemase RacX [Phoenix dactylifera]
MLDGSTTMSSFPIRLVDHGVARHRMGRPKAWPSSSVRCPKPSSVLLQTDGGDDLSDSRSSTPASSRWGSGSESPVLALPNTVGVIGGVSAVSTVGFLEKLVAWSSGDGGAGLPFIACSDPVLSRELSSRKRTSFLSPASRNTDLRIDHASVVENLRRKRIFLESSGARCIVMPCHISSSWHEEISEGCSVPFLHVGECVAEELEAANLKPVEAGSNLRIGVLDTDALSTASFYTEKLQNQGFEVLLPDKETMEHTVIPAVGAFHRKDVEGARNLLRIALQVLLVRAVSTIILASDDMQGLLPRDDPLLKKCIDPMDALVRATIRWADSRANNEQ